MTAKTLDGVIRERAHRELRKKIEDRFDFTDLIPHLQWVKLPDNWKTASGHNADMGDVIRAVTEELYAYLKGPAGDDAVANFIARVDGMQSELDELRTEVQG